MSKENELPRNEWFENLPKQEALTDADRVEKCPLTEFQKQREETRQLTINQLESEQD